MTVRQWVARRTRSSCLPIRHRRSTSPPAYRRSATPTFAAALSCRRSSRCKRPRVTAFFDQLVARGKKPLQAYVAVMRNAAARHLRHVRDQHGTSSPRNSMRWPQKLLDNRESIYRLQRLRDVRGPKHGGVLLGRWRRNDAGTPCRAGQRLTCSAWAGRKPSGGAAGKTDGLLAAAKRLRPSGTMSTGEREKPAKDPLKTPCISPHVAIEGRLRDDRRSCPRLRRNPSRWDRRGSISDSAAPASRRMLR